MSVSVTPSIFKGEIELQPERRDAPVVNDVVAFKDKTPPAESYQNAFDPNESQKSPSSSKELMYTNEPILQEVPVEVEVKTFDFKTGFLFLSLGFLAIKFFKKGRK